MKSIIKFIIPLVFLFSTTISAQESTYKISFEADPLIKVLNGEEIQGEANIGISLFGKDGEEIMGSEIAYGTFPTIKLDEEDDIRVNEIEVELQGRDWTKSVKIQRIFVTKITETQFEDKKKKYTFNCNCSLTPGNSKVSVNARGTMDFEADESVLAAEEMEGFAMTEDFSSADAQGKGFVLSKRPIRTYKEVTDKQENKEIVNGKERVCTTEKVSQSAAFSKNFLTNSSNAIVFPGSMVYAEDLVAGEYRPIPVTKGRAPFMISTNAAILGAPSRIQAEPSLDGVREGMREMFIGDGDKRGDLTTSSNYRIHEVSSTEELSMKLGGHFSNATMEINVDFNLNTTKEETMKVIQFYHKFYTVDVTQPDAPEDWFSDPKSINLILEDPEQRTPLYVSSVTYGVIGYFFVKTSMSTSDMEAILDAAYEKGSRVEIDAALNLMRSNSSVEKNALIIGASADNGIPTDYEGFLDMMRTGVNLSPNALAEPISYTLKYLSDNGQCRVNMVTDYVNRECREVTSTIQDAVVKLHSVKVNQEVGFSGNVTAYLCDKPDCNQMNPRKVFVKELYTPENYLPMKKDEPKVLDHTSAPFKIDVRQDKLSEYYLAVMFTVQEHDYNIFYGNDRGVETKYFRLKDIINLYETSSANPNDPTSMGAGRKNTVEVTFDGKTFILEFSVQSSN